MSMGILRDLGPCQVTWNGTDLGPSNGGVKIKITDTVKDIREDGAGEAPVDAVFTGRKVEDIEIPLTRLSLTQLQAVLPGSTKTNDSVDLPNVVGGAMYDLAKQMILKPLINGVASVDPDEWLTIYKTYPTASWELGYDNATQRTYKTKFQVFPVADSGTYTGKFGHVGDPNPSA